VSKEEYDDNFEAIFGEKKLNVWENPPRIDEGDRPDGGQTVGVPEGPDGSLDSQTQEPAKETGCPCCGKTLWPDGTDRWWCPSCKWTGEAK
jgi:ribosomal protein S27AE